MGLIECLMSEESNEIQYLSNEIRLLKSRNEYLRNDNELLQQQVHFLSQQNRVNRERAGEGVLGEVFSGFSKMAEEF